MTAAQQQSLLFWLVLTAAFHDAHCPLAATGGHSHTFLTGVPAPAGQPQLAGSPNPNLTSAARETAVAAGPYPTNVLNGAKSIPVVTAYWGSRWVGGWVGGWLGGWVGKVAY